MGITNCSSYFETWSCMQQPDTSEELSVKAVADKPQRNLEGEKEPQESSKLETEKQYAHVNSNTNNQNMNSMASVEQPSASGAGLRQHLQL